MTKKNNDADSNPAGARDRYVASTTSQYMDSADQAAHEQRTLDRIHDANMNPRVVQISRALARDHTTPAREAYMGRQGAAYLRRR